MNNNSVCEISPNSKALCKQRIMIMNRNDVIKLQQTNVLIFTVGAMKANTGKQVKMHM